MKASVIKTTGHNTNNSWGFGGAIYTRMEYSNGVVIEYGHACFRHAPSQPFTRAYYNGMSIYGKVSSNEEGFHVFDNKALFKSNELHMYENETGYQVALQQHAGESFSLNYHDYKFVETVKI